MKFNSRNSLIHFGAGLVLVIYPLLIFFGLKVFDIKILAMGLCLVMGIRMLILKTQNQMDRSLLYIFGVVVVLNILAFFSESLTAVKAYPVVINLGLFYIFMRSLKIGIPVIERIARLKHPSMDLNAIQYTRKVTQVWTGFFVVNAGISLFSLFFLTDEGWTIYNCPVRARST